VTEGQWLEEQVNMFGVGTRRFEGKGQHLVKLKHLLKTKRHGDHACYSVSKFNKF
jgi:hypothetical protein